MSPESPEKVLRKCPQQVLKKSLESPEKVFKIVFQKPSKSPQKVLRNS
jgi:hypothetical protein